jgi:hypothetical protein
MTEDEGLTASELEGSSPALRAQESLLDKLLLTPSMSVVMVLDDYAPGWSTFTLTKNDDGSHTADVDFDEPRGLSAVEGASPEDVRVKSE